MLQRLLAVSALCILVAACGQAGGKAGRVDGERLAAASGNGEWLAVGRTYDEQRYSPLDKINISNVKDLGLAWYYEFDTDRGQEATPVMVDGVLYT
ncbi:MAG: PQQ-dependent dehydrogenase, methanol/ethanol family, partial [Phenylobacterium sp.]